MDQLSIVQRVLLEVRSHLYVVARFLVENLLGPGCFLPAGLSLLLLFFPYVRISVRGNASIFLRSYDNSQVFQFVSIDFYTRFFQRMGLTLQFHQ